MHCKMIASSSLHVLCYRPAKVSDIVADMLGNKLITKQTPKDGVKVNTVCSGHVTGLTDCWPSISLE